MHSAFSIQHSAFTILLALMLWPSAANAQRDRYHSGGQGTDAVWLVVSSEFAGHVGGGGSNRIFRCDGTNEKAQIRAACKSIHNLSNKWTWQNGGASIHTGDFGWVVKVSTTYHMFYGNGTAIKHSTSSDGITWTGSTTVLDKAAAGQWDASLVGVPTAWYDSGSTTWYLLYRGASGTTGGIGLATRVNADPAGAFTRTTAGGGTATGRVINDTLNEDPSGIIKVGSDYYLYCNSTSGNRQLVAYTTTDVTDHTKWAKVGPDPLFTGYRFCADVFYNSTDSRYYLLIARFYNAATEGVLELWSDTAPTFAPSSRRFDGIVVYDSTGQLDTPCVITDDVTRTLAGTDTLQLFLTSTRETGYKMFYLTGGTVTAAVANVSVPRAGTLRFSPGTFEVDPDTLSTSYTSLDFWYGTVVEGSGAKITIPDSHDAAIPQFLSVCDDSVVRDLVLDGNKANQATGLMSGVVAAAGGRCVDVTVQNWTNHGFYWCDLGRLIRCLARDNTVDGFNVRAKTRLTDCEASGNGDEGLDVVGDHVIAESFYAHHNAGNGVALSGDYFKGSIKSTYNTQDGIFCTGASYADLTVDIHDNDSQGIMDAASGNRLLYSTITGRIYNHNGTGSTYGIFLYGDYNVLNGLIIENCTGANSRQNYIDGDNNRITNCRFFKGAANSNYGLYWSANSASNILQNCQHDCNTGLAEDGAAAANTERDNP